MRTGKRRKNREGKQKSKLIVEPSGALHDFGTSVAFEPEDWEGKDRPEAQLVHSHNLCQGLGSSK